MWLLKTDVIPGCPRLRLRAEQRKSYRNRREEAPDGKQDQESSRDKTEGDMKGESAEDDDA